MRGIVWFRRDLRIVDQPALTAACEACNEVMPLFVFDEPLLKAQVFGSASVSFMLGCLEELASALAGSGLALQWRRGKPVEEVVGAVRDWHADIVYWNRDYEPAALERDRAVQQQLAQMGVIVRTFKDHVVFEAEEVRGATGDPLQRYSAYRARWWTKWQTAKPCALPAPARLSAAPLPFLPPSSPLPSVRELGYAPVVLWIQPGERSAQRQLRWFLDGPVDSYADDRNRPALDGSSKLSPHFRFGTMTPRVAIREALDALTAGRSGSRADVLAWIDELIWREFFQQVLVAFPRVAAGPFRNVAPPSREPGPERDRLYQAWCDGRTGYPIVDAGMRQLMTTGWMHNRVRMIAASFLIKDLRIDWQSGERYFMQHLLDADVAANNGNWQWCASTGTDAMGGYRIFNPVLQSRKCDPDAIYIREYVPELAKVAGPWIHEPHLMSAEEQRRSDCRIGTDYPWPIVDHRRAREAYLSSGRQQASK